MSWLKKMAKGLGWSVLTLYLVLFFTPKANLYYLGEGLLSKQQIFINGEKARDTGFGLVLEHPTLLFQGITAATVPEVSVLGLVVYNRVHVAPFSLNEDLAAFLPPKIEALEIRHSILAPHQITLYAKGDFGEVIGVADLLHRTIEADLKISSAMQKNYGAMLRYLNKTKEGYRYASTF